MRGAGVTAGVVGAIVAPDLAGQRRLHRAGRPGRRGHHLRQASHKTGPGFNWRWPAPFQAHEIVNVRAVRTAEIGYRGNVRNKQPNEALMLTDDENIVDIQFAVQYKLKDPVAWVFNNRDQDETPCAQVAETRDARTGRPQQDGLRAVRRPRASSRVDASS